MLQFALITAFIGIGIAGPRWPEPAWEALSVVGAVLALAGALLAAISARALGRGITPFPRPLRHGEFVGRGPYRLARHPIYLGGILFFTGLALVFSPAALVPTVALAIVWALKATVEERFLLAEYPAYAAYRERARYRLIPFVY